MIKVTDENGVEQDAILASEYESKVAESQKAINDAKAEAQAAKEEAEKYKKVSAEKTDNFKKLNEMSEKEKETFSAKEIENMKRIEAAEAKAAALENKINEDVNSRIVGDKEKALAQYHGGNKELKEALEKNFDLINLVGSSTDTIYERARLAANMEKGKLGSNNPLYAHMNGASPRIQEKGDREKFMESDKAAKALKLMGDKK